MRSKWLMMILVAAPAWALAQNGGANDRAASNAHRDGLGVVNRIDLWVPAVPSRTGARPNPEHVRWGTSPIGGGPGPADPVTDPLRTAPVIPVRSTPVSTPVSGSPSTVPAASAPEVNSRLAAGAMTFLLGGLMVLRGRRRGSVRS
jgi:hypothetical protein